MRVFVTGGTGFIGSHLVEYLSARGVEIFVLLRDLQKESELRKRGVRIQKGDLSSLDAFPPGLDIVFHLAGKTSSLKSADYYTVNQGGTASLFRALRTRKERPKVVLLSSLAAAGPSASGRPVRESDPPHPATPYGWSKLRSEQEALKYKDEFPIVIARASAIFGPKDKGFEQYLRLVSKGVLPTIREKKQLSLCYVKDLAEALFLCSQKNLGSGETFNIADSQPYTWDELGEAAARSLGIKPRRLTIPRPLLYCAAAISEASSRVRGRPQPFDRDKYRDLVQPGWVADVSKAYTILSFRPRYTLEEAAKETMAWYLAYKWR